MNRDSLSSCASKLVGAVELIERNALWVIVCWTLFYTAITLFLAHEKPFWNDELFTFYISRLRSFSDIWKALLTGAEQLPPFFFVATRAATAVFGSSETSFRLPEIFGFWLMSMGVFQFVRVRLPIMYALAGMTFPLITGAFEYAYEARPYGLVLGFCALALCCWQAAAGGRLRTLSLIGLALSSAAAISCHYYAVLGLAGIFVGECVRSLSKRRIDAGIWSAFAAGFIPLIFFFPLLKAARSYSGTFWSKPKWTNTLGFYNTLFTPTGFTLFLVLLALGGYAMTRSAHTRDRASVRSRMPGYELAAALAFAVVPVVGVLFAEALTGAFTFRYALPAIIGLSILFAWSSSAAARQRADAGLVLFLILLALSLSNAARLSLDIRGRLNARTSAYEFLKAEAQGAPVIIVAPHLFFELSYDVAQRKSALRLIYLADRALALRYANTDTVDRGLLELKKWAPLDVRDFSQFCASHDTFLVYGYPDLFEWGLEDLIAQGWKLTVKARNGSRLLYVANRPREP